MDYCRNRIQNESLAILEILAMKSPVYNFSYNSLFCFVPIIASIIVTRTVHCQLHCAYLSHDSVICEVRVGL